MKSQNMWALPVSLLLLCGCGEKPQSVVEESKQGIGDANSVVSEAQRKCSERLGLPVEITNSIGMKLVLIPPGKFMMGSPDSASFPPNQKPQHQVRITKPFFLGKYEVTQEQYEKVMGTNPSAFSKSGLYSEKFADRDTGDLPVEMVSLADAQEFCRKLSELPGEKEAGRHYRLPTEAEWEYACRAGSTTKWCFGNDQSRLGNYAWYRKNSEGETHQVGRKNPNAWGLHDMHGNVWEWCTDWHDVEYYRNSPTDDPTGPSEGSDRVSRGGCCLNQAHYSWSATRFFDSPGRQDVNLGLRVYLVWSDE